jgi:hypothetical protein
MKKFTWSSIVVLFSAVGLAECPRARTAPRTDQERFVLHEIQSRIDESIEASQAQDLPAKMHYAAPDLALKLLDGTILDRKQIEAGMKRDSDWILAVSDQTTIKIECIELKGTEAVLFTDPHFVRTVPERKDGSPHERITNVTHREIWAYTKAGWLTKRMDELKPGPTTLTANSTKE